MDESRKDKDGEEDLLIVPEVAGRYSLRERGSGSRARAEGQAELGHGGIGRVLLAFDENLGREVALKELLPQPEGGEATAEGPVSRRVASVARFLREARVTGQLEHPNIVPVYELGRRANGALYYTMKVVRGRTLDQALAGCEGLRDRLRLLGHFVDLCQAVAYAHSRGVVHRDLKPQNVMLGEFGETVVLDWGLAKVKGLADIRSPDARPLSQPGSAGSSITVDGTAMGTPAFMSPEQAEGRLDAIDERSDVWSLGAVLHTILAGFDPYEARTVVSTTGEDGRDAAGSRPVHSMPPEAPPELVSVCDKALSRDKHGRYASAKELAAEVEAFLTGGRVKAYEYRTWELIRRFAAKHRLILATAAAAFVLVVILGVAAYLRVVAERNLALSAEQAARQAERTERLRRAEAQWEGANAALMREDLLEARAKLRGSLEVMDSAAGRALWWLLSRDPLVWKQELDVPVYDLAYSPDGRTIAAACADKSVYLFDPKTRAMQRVLRGHHDQVLTVAYAPNGGLLASGSWNGEVWLWDTTSGMGKPLPGQHAAAVYGLAFSPDGRTLASSGADHRIKIWSIHPEGRAVSLAQELLGHEDNVATVAFSPDGKGLVSGSFDKSIRWWARDPASPEKGWQYQRSFLGHSAAVLDLNFSPDGKLLASSSRDKTALVWDVGSGQPVQTLTGHSLAVWGVRFSPDGKTIVTSCIDKIVRLWPVDPGAPPKAGPAAQLLGHTDGVRRLAFSPDGRFLASASWDKSIRIWDWKREQRTRLSTGHTEGVLDISFSPDGKKLATGSRDKSVRLWDVATGRQLQVLQGHTSSVWGVSFSPDGASLATGGDDAMVVIWELATGKQKQALFGHEDPIWMVRYSRDGALLASGGTDKIVRLWETGDGGSGKAGKLRHLLQGHTDLVLDASFSPDGRTLATSSRDKTIRLWDLATGKQTRVLQGHTDEVWGVGFSPDGKQLVSGSTDRTVRLWDLATGNNRIVGEHPGRVYWVAFHPDGKRVGSPSSDHTARIWDITPGHEGRYVELKGHRGEVNFLRFSPDGKLVATSSDDGTVRLWDSDTGRPFWRAPGLLSSLEFVSHQGWTRLGQAAPAPAPREWRRALSERSRLAADGGGRLCLGTFADRLEQWDTPIDRRLSETPVPNIDALLAVPGGCLVLADGKARLYPGAGEVQELVGANASAIAWDEQTQPPWILVAADRQVTAFSSEGRKTAVFAADPGVTAMVRSPDWLVLGYQEGNIELVSLATGVRRPEFSFEGAPSSPVESLRSGEMNTLVAGYGNGLLGIWNLETGKRLDAARLHGPVSHLMISGNKLFAATELGSTLEWDLGVFHAPSCDLLREIWADVPVVWEEGRPVLQDPPADHPCNAPGKTVVRGSGLDTPPGSGILGL